jgi:hypothetical protein
MIGAIDSDFQLWRPAGRQRSQPWIDQRKSHYSGRQQAKNAGASCHFVPSNVNDVVGK